MTLCREGGKITPRNGYRIYVGGRWTWRCRCGTVAIAYRMGWIDGEFGLITEPHKKGRKK